jgi:transposase-like protein
MTQAGACFLSGSILENIERLFVEVRRRIRTMCAFTTRSSCERILLGVFERMNPHWTRHPLPAFTHNS